MASAWIPSLALAAHLVPARELEARERRGRLPTAIEGLDTLLGGGWPRGAVSELAGARTSGRTAVLLASIAEALARGETAALVDVGGALDPRTAERTGVSLARLLWVRCATAGKALAAAEIVLGAGGFGMVAVDLGDERPRVPTAAWVRLKRAADQQGTAVLVVTERRMPGALGACALTLHRARPRFEMGHGTAPLLVAVDAEATRARGAGEDSARLAFAAGASER